MDRIEREETLFSGVGRLSLYQTRAALSMEAVHYTDGSLKVGVVGGDWCVSRWGWGIVNVSFIQKALPAAAAGVGVAMH